ncbi:MAG: hypothetical protein LBE80_03745, partial [Deltaproteobacteria bacterium]|nr:hypothetical protein [Deltaproteobacteria bacterium]
MAFDNGEPTLTLNGNRFVEKTLLLAKGENFDSDYQVLMAARPNPYNRGNCFQWKKCLGETIGNMWVDTPEFCGPLGGKSWKGRDGKCLDLL